MTAPSVLMSPPPPTIDDLVYASLQVWHNPRMQSKQRGGSTKPEWAVKIETKVESNFDAPAEVYMLGLLPSPKKLREAARRYVVDGKITSDWRDDLCIMSYNLAPDFKVGFLSKYDETGRSSNAKTVFDGYWGSLQLDAAGQLPVEVVLHLGSSQSPLVVGPFIPTSSKNPKAAGWLAEHDPMNMRGVVQLAKARARRNLTGEQRDEHLVSGKANKVYIAMLNELEEKDACIDTLKMLLATANHQIAELERWRKLGQ